jgi:ribosomal protein L37E
MSDIEDKRHTECKACGTPFIRYNTIQSLCRDCSIARAKKLAPARARLRREVRLIEMQGNARTGALLKTISMKPRKPIAKMGKVAKRDKMFLMKVLRPYLDNKFGVSCAKCGALPAIKEDGTFFDMMLTM